MRFSSCSRDKKRSGVRIFYIKRIVTWGKGQYGRLSHEFSDDQHKPTFVEVLLGYLRLLAFLDYFRRLKILCIVFSCFFASEHPVSFMPPFCTYTPNQIGSELKSVRGTVIQCYETKEWWIFFISNFTSLLHMRPFNIYRCIWCTRRKCRAGLLERDEVFVATGVHRHGHDLLLVLKCKKYKFT